MAAKKTKKRASKTTTKRSAKVARKQKPASRKATTARRTSKKAIFSSPPVRFVAGGDNTNLAKIDHIVVLMLENRSFDAGHKTGGWPATSQTSTH